jgi:predicted TIM-barrel fold metal-dependent hydrolase
MTRPVVVIDGDGHICEPDLVWTEYTQKKFRDDVLQVRTIDGESHIFIEGRQLPFGGGATIAHACVPGGFEPGQHPTWADIPAGSHDPAARLKVMDDEGIDQALLFPSTHLLTGDVTDPTIAAETCRAYNDWISDFCKRDPSRLFAMGLVPMQDVDLAIKEAKRLASIGLKGFMSRPERYRDLALYDPACDGLWHTAVTDGLAVGIHGSFGSQMHSFSTGRYKDNLFYDHMIAHPFGQMAVMMDLIAGGVMDRFPELRVGFFESGLGWMPYWIDRLDEHFEVMGHHTPWLKRKPSEIFAEQCFVSMEADELSGLKWMVEKGLGHCVVWGSDYPHFDSTFPGAYREAEQTFTTVGTDIASAVVYNNPRRYMGVSN